MPVMICIICKKPVPDSFHDFEEICNCNTKQEWIDEAKRKNWLKWIMDKK